MLRQLTDLNFNWRGLIFICCQGDMSVRILRPALYSSAEVHFGSSQAREMELFAKIVNVFLLTLLTIVGKVSMVDVCRGPEHISDLF